MRDIMQRTTGMGVAAVSRVTDDRWIACSVRDDITFGMQPGGELKIESTICNEIPRHREPVVINNVADEVYCGHQRPASNTPFETTREKGSSRVIYVTMSGVLWASHSRSSTGPKRQPNPGTVMSSRIVTCAHRYKRPSPKNAKTAATGVPAIVTAPCRGGTPVSFSICLSLASESQWVADHNDGRPRQWTR